MKSLLIAPFILGRNIFRRSLFVRYVFSGGTAAAIDVILLYALVDFFGVYYLSAAVFAMTISFIARFLLQKYVTFEDRDEGQSKKQFLYYSILYAASLSATTALLYLFVDILHIWYVPAQIASILIIAAGCFFIYRLFIFKNR
jgi:dolichol-phosphate mannosyltransferase